MRARCCSSGAATPAPRAPAGEPRQGVDHRRHREDHHAALAFVRERSDVDVDRVALWGSSFSGEHVIVVAAADQRIAAVVSQDNAAPVSAIRRVAAPLGDRAEVLSFDCGHFEVYVDEVLEQSSTARVDFLARVLRA